MIRQLKRSLQEETVRDKRNEGEKRNELSKYAAPRLVHTYLCG